MKRLRYNTWQDLAWYGITLSVPDEWNPGQLVGDPRSGNVRLDDAQIVRVEVEWKEAGGNPEVARIVDRYVEGLAKNAQKQKQALSVERRVPIDGLGHSALSGAECFRWKGTFEVTTLAGYSEITDRLLFIRVMNRPDEDANELLADLFNSVGDTGPDDWQPWGLYGLTCRTPPDYPLEEYDLKSGHIRLLFKKDKALLRIDRLSLARTLLSGSTLADWYRDFFAKDLRFIDTDIHDQNDGTITIDGAPKGRVQSLLQPLPFWNTRPRLFLDGRAWVSDEENKIFALQSFYAREEDAPNLDRIQATMSEPTAAEPLGSNERA